MRQPRTLSMAGALLVAGALLAAPADAGGRHGHGHHGHGHFSLSIGVPIAAGIAFGYGLPRYGYPYSYSYYPYYPYSYYPYYPYAPRVIVVQPSPAVTYIEQTAPPQPTAQAPAQNWWYWCAGANAYHPYVSECPGGWQRVTPQPPAPQ